MSEEVVSPESQDESPNAGSTTTAERWPSAVTAWCAVFVLTAAYLVSWIDRQVLILLIPQLEHSFGLSDTKVALLHGVAFAVFYTIAGLPMGWLADNSARKRVIGINITIWSLATATCGLARSFGHLFGLRLVVATGEAALIPSAISIMADLFPEHRRAQPMGVFSCAGGLGSGLALVVGGAILSFMSSIGAIELPLLGRLEPWQSTFLVIGLPGILIALAMFAIPEPVRRGATRERFRLDDLRRFASSKRSILLPLFLCFASSSVSIFAVNTWAPTFFIRIHGWSPAEVGARFGTAMLLASLVGGIGSGFFTGWRTARGRSDAAVLSVRYGAVIALLPGIVAPLVPNPNVAAGLFGIFGFGIVFSGAALLTVLQNITPNLLRGTTVAALFVVSNIIGMGLGPLAVALSTDYVFGADSALGRSMAVVLGITTPLTVWLAHRSVSGYHLAMRDGPCAS
jgi:MFS family permease